MHEMILGKLAREAEHARAGQARVIAKMNALVDAQAIEALYRASRAGVKIDLIVRGVCALRPGIPGVSENISRALDRRALPRALARVLFRERRRGRSCTARARTGWSATSSAAWKSAFPILRRHHIERILRDLDLCLSDNCQAWKLKADGQYERIARGEARALNVQSELLATYAAGPATIS